MTRRTPTKKNRRPRMPHGLEGDKWRCVACKKVQRSERGDFAAMAVPTAVPGYLACVCGPCALRLLDSTAYRRQTEARVSRTGFQYAVPVADLDGGDFIPLKIVLNTGGKQ